MGGLSGTVQHEIPFFGAHRENAELKAELAACFDRVMASDKLLNGPEQKRLEAEIARATGRTYAVAVNSGTDALTFALLANGIGPGDDVLVPAYSFVATASAVMLAGARPVFVDVSPPDSKTNAPLTMDLDLAAEAVTPRTRAMVVAWMFGGMGDPAPVAAFAARHDLVLVEDASQAFGAGFKDSPAGSMGRASVFSFDRNKPLGAQGTGGIVVCDDPETARATRALRYHGVSATGYERLGRNSQMSELTAAILMCKLGHCNAWAERRRSIAARFESALTMADASAMTWAPATRHNYHKFVVLSRRRDHMAKILKALGIPTKIHYDTPLPFEGVFHQFVPAGARFPVAQSVSRLALSLPIHAQLTDQEVQRIQDGLKSQTIDSAA